MKKVLLVDDERPVLDGMQLIIKRDLSDLFEIVGVATSGREAIEKTMALAPDLVLMDIHMPGLSGIEAIREIKKRKATCLFILITAYERFDIAQEAVGLGVFAYLTKPVTRDRLASTLKDAHGYLEQDQPKTDLDVSIREREEELRGWVETAFMQGIVLGQDFSQNLEPMVRVLGIGDNPIMMAVLSLRNIPGIDPSLDSTRELAQRVTTTLRFKTNALVGTLFGGLMAICIPLRSTTDEATVAGSFLEVLRQNYPDEINRGLLTMGTGKAVDLRRAADSWAAALYALGKPGSTRGTGPGDPENLYPFEEELSFIEAAADGDRVLARLGLERLLQPFNQASTVSLADRYQFIALFVLVLHQLQRQQRIEKETMLRHMVMEDLRNADSGPSLVQIVRSRWLELMQDVKNLPHWSPAVATTLERIKKSFHEQLSLEGVAMEAGISPNRLSRLFIEETGKAFSEFLIQVRIDHAKALLVIPGASIKQVSLACGYLDPNYFARLFKKITGQTPSSFAGQKFIDEGEQG